MPLLKIATSPAEVDTIAQDSADAARNAAGATPDERAKWLSAVADALREHDSELISIADRETHLGETRLTVELRRTAFQLDLLADEVRSGATLDATIDHADPDWGMGPRPDIRRVNVPLGVVGVYGASNFPFAFSVIGGDSAAALAAGCSVIHKVHSAHHELAMRTAEVVVAALKAAGAPENLFSVVDGREAGVAMVQHPSVKAVGFTGSTTVGRKLFDIASAREEPIPFFGELGSTNPVFVLPKAWESRSDEILGAFAQSFTMGVGQFCTKPGSLFIPEGSDDVGTRLKEALAETSRGQMLTAGLREGYGASVDEMSTRTGVSTLVAGSSGKGDDDAPEPTVFEVTAEQVLADPAIVATEMFGPATVLVRYSDPAQLLKVAAALEGQLTASLQAELSDDYTELFTQLTERAGRVLWNEWPTGVTVSYAQVHGGPYPATTASSTTSVGTAAVQRFQRPVAFQGFPEEALPPALQEANPWSIIRRVDGVVVPAQN